MEKRFLKLYNKLIRFIRKTPYVFKAGITIMMAVCLFIMGVKISIKPTSKETVIDFGFKNVGKLVTQEWYGRIVEDSSKNRKIFKTISVPFTESRLIFSIDVEVLAGVDFEEIKYDVLFDEKKIEITIPHSEIYKAYEIPKSFISYLDEESWFANIDSTEQQELKDRVVEKGTAQAIDSGLLQKADENAKNIIRHMIKGNTLTKNFEIIFKYKEKEVKHG